MKHKTLSLAILTSVLILQACSLFAMAGSSGEQPTPVSGSIPGTDYQEVVVDQVTVEVVVSGAWPDLCLKIAGVRSEMNGYHV